MGYTNYKPSYSYSRLNVYDACSFKYHLTYDLKHFFFTESAATLFGTLVHFIEESIADSIKEGKPIDYDKLKYDFVHVNIPKQSPKDHAGDIFGTDIIKERYPEEYYQADANGISYAKKAEEYLEHGIYRLENYLKENPDLSVVGTEQYFSIQFNDHTLSGYIDRIFYNKATNTYIVEDIKTKNKPFKDEELAKPLQFVIYALAVQSIYEVDFDHIVCCYDLPFCDMKQGVTDPAFLKGGVKKLEKIFSGIESKEYKPHPSPLCAYCPFSGTYQNQPEEAMGLCCYYSLWTKGGNRKVWEVAHKWEGMEKDEEIRKEFFFKDDFDFDF